VLAACSSARTTLVPTAITRPPFVLARRIAVSVASGMKYGSSNGSLLSSSGSPVDEMPAATVIVANAIRRPRIARIESQSSAKLADGGSNAAGSPAIDDQTSHSASGVAMCAYWIGRPWRAIPAHTAAGDPPNRSETRRG
jgi:hypothetical protein